MTDPKQEIYNILYKFSGGESVLDVGCGASPPLLKVKRHTLVDIKNGVDWYDFDPGRYDVIVANDIFPNVDQRLELFLDKYLPCCKEMRLSLTYFDKPKWYQAKRVDGDEILTMQMWGRERIFEALNRVAEYKHETYQGRFENGRKVLLVWLKGGLS